MKKYTDQEMAALINEVEEQFAKHLAKMETTKEEVLEKSEDTSTNAEITAVEVTEEETVEPTISTEEVVEKSEEIQSFDYNENDFIEMDKLYQSMSKAEQEAHYGSLRKTLFKSEEIKEVAKVEAQVEAIEKTEVIEKTELTLEKKEIDGLKQENEDLRKNLEKLTIAFTKFVEKTPPKRKAITKIEYIKKSEEVGKDVSNLSKSEITKILSEKVRTDSLSKKDRDAINDYYLSSSTTIDSIKHLL